MATQPQSAPRPHGAPDPQMAPAERLLLWSLRAWTAGRLAGLSLAPLERQLASRTSEKAAALFLGWVEAVEATGLRPIAAECPDCGGASSDLQRLVIACGVAPVAFETGERLLAPLVAEPYPVMVMARALNAALAAAGWPLPVRLGEPAPAAAPRRTLH